jgi:hypothetical protein
MANVKTGPDNGPIPEVERLLVARSGQAPALRAAVVHAVTSHDHASDSLWRWIVGGLLALATLALVGLLYLVGDGNAATQPELAMAAFVGLLGGLMGMLSGAPWRRPAG